MACQGCGKDAGKKLCCPQCVQLGRKSFFCSQECFTKNWKSHNQLHELLKKQKAAEALRQPVANAEDASMSNSGAPPAPPVSGLSGGPTPARTRAPLPGGSALLSHLAPEKKANGLSKKTDGPPPGGLGDVVGRWGSAMFGTAAGSQDVVSAQKVRARGASRERSSQEGSRGRSSSRGQEVKAPSQVNGGGKSLTSKTGLRALGALCVMAAGTYYLLFWQTSNMLRDEQVDELTLVDSDGTLASVVATENTPLPSGGINMDSKEAYSSVTAAQMHSEINSLRVLLERHDKMLRYIMDRYVEKDSPLIRQAKLEGAVVPESTEPAKPEAQVETKQPKVEGFEAFREESQVFLPARPASEGNETETIHTTDSDANLPVLNRHRRKGGKENIGSMDEPAPIPWGMQAGFIDGDPANMPGGFIDGDLNQPASPSVGSGTMFEAGSGGSGKDSGLGGQLRT